jgi:hypothetical protein
MDISKNFKQRLSEEGPSTLDNNLRNNGYSVIENALPLHILQGLAEEIEMLEGVLKSSPNRLSVSDSDIAIITKPGVNELSIIERSSLAIDNNGLIALLENLKSFWINRIAVMEAFRSSCSSLSSLTTLDQVKVAMITKGMLGAMVICAFLTYILFIKVEAFLVTPTHK